MALGEMARGDSSVVWIIYNNGFSIESSEWL